MQFTPVLRAVPAFLFLTGASLSAQARHRVTTRYVQLLFEHEGTTFSEYVLNKRLARAHRMLSDPRYVGWTVSAIALEAGFGDVSYFNRCFRRRYGATPTQLRGAPRDAP